MTETADKIPMHVALLGHIDHGKTKLAEKLSEVISTAGLDKHPQARERGITIDLGFTAFTLDKFLITLIDAPGHADLIRSVVAASAIADAAILVVAANEGPKIQTGEHILILEGFQIDRVVVALTKIDLIKSHDISTRIKEVRNVLVDTSFSEAPIIPISAETSSGLPALKDALLKTLELPNRALKGAFKMPVDHSFSIKGTGTVVTGTIHRGHLAVGDSVEILPDRQRGKVKSIQVFRNPRKEAQAGDRVGVAVAGLNAQRISRGYYLAEPDSLKVVQELLIDGKMNELYKGDLHPKMMVHLTIGMPTVAGSIFPYKESAKENIITEKVEPGESFRALLRLTEKITTEEGDPVLISRLDLPATKLRILASGRVIAINPENMEFVREKVKRGIVRNAHRKGYLIDQIAQSKVGAEKYLGNIIRTASGIEGRILETFGTKGALLATFEGKLREGELVSVTKTKRYKI